MNLTLKITSTTPKAELSELLRLPLGLDIWEVKADRMQSLIKDVHGMTNVAQQTSQLYPTAGDPPTGPAAFTTLSNCVRATLTEAALSFRPTRFKLSGRKISRLPWSLSDTFLSPNHIC
jgi:hypothetical protein